MKNKYIPRHKYVEAIRFEDRGAVIAAICDLIPEHNVAANYDDPDNPTLCVPTVDPGVHLQEGDYIAVDNEGHVNLIDGETFETAFFPAALRMTGLTFGEAIEALKEGKRVAREGWNGKNMWLCLSGEKEDRKIPAHAFWSEHTRNYAESQGGFALVAPAIVMKAADSKLVMGWLASQTDMLAEDWTILPEAAQPCACEPALSRGNG